MEDDTEDMLISLNQSNVFHRVDHQFMAAVLVTIGFELELSRWINILYRSPQAVVQMNGVLCNWVVGPAGLSLVSFPYVRNLESQLRRVRDEKANPSPISVPLVGRVRSPMIFVSRRSGIEAVKKTVQGDNWSQDQLWQEQISAYKGGVPLSVPFR